MKNIEVMPLLEGIKKIEDLKLGGVKTKIILKNKKALIKTIEELEEVKKKLIEQYADPKIEGKQDVTFSPENQITINQEWLKVMEAESDIKLEFINKAELDQFSDLTLAQTEVLDLMSE